MKRTVYRGWGIERGEKEWGRGGEREMAKREEV